MILLWVSVGQYFIFGALCPSKSGLMNKHIVKHIVIGASGRQTQAFDFALCLDQ